MNNEIRLQRLLEWIKSHGNHAYIAGNAIMVESRLVYPDGSVEIETDQVENMSEARELLGYYYHDSH